MPVVSFILALLLLVTISGSGNMRSDVFEITDESVSIRWIVQSRDEDTCYFVASLLGLNEDGSIRSNDRIAWVTVPSGQTARKFGFSDTANGRVTLAVEPGRFTVSVLSEQYRYADGSTDGCKSFSVDVD